MSELASPCLIVTVIYQRPPLPEWTATLFGVYDKLQQNSTLCRIWMSNFVEISRILSNIIELSRILSRNIAVQAGVLLKT